MFSKNVLRRCLASARQLRTNQSSLTQQNRPCGQDCSALLKCTTSNCVANHPRLRVEELASFLMEGGHREAAFSEICAQISRIRVSPRCTPTPMSVSGGMICDDFVNIAIRSGLDVMSHSPAPRNTQVWMDTAEQPCGHEGQAYPVPHPQANPLVRMTVSS